MEDRVVPIEKAAAPVSLFDFGSNLDRAWKFASTLSESQIIPDTFKRNPASCLIALDMANRMRRNPLEVMQAMYIVHGKPSFSSSFLISLINSCGYYEPLRFEFKSEGDGRSCMAWTVDKRTGGKVEGPVVSIQMARAEGWYDKSGSKWKTMPEVMLRYRAASFFSRAYCPDLTGGFHSEEEVRDEQTSVNVVPRASIEEELLAQNKALPEAPKKPTQPKAQQSEPQQDLAPINPEMLPFDDAPAAPQESPKPAAVSEVERLRTELMDGLRLSMTEQEAEAWCMEHFKKTFKALTKDELKTAVAKLNAELDAKDK